MFSTAKKLFNQSCNSCLNPPNTNYVDQFKNQPPNITFARLQTIHLLRARIMDDANIASTDQRRIEFN